MIIFGLEIQRARFRRRRLTLRRLLALFAAAGLVTALGAAYAAWTSSATGSAAAKAGTITFTLQATSASSGITNTLRPGSVAGTATGDATGGDLKVTLNNTSGFTVHVTSVAVNGLILSDKNGVGCTSDQGAFTFPNAFTPGTHGVTVGTGGTFTPSVGVSATLTVPGTGVNTDVVIPNALNMTAASNTNCQGAVFTIPVTVTVSS
jgi:hypothetical protein